MASQNAWSLMDPDQQDQLASLGMNLMKAGAVDPLKAAKKFGSKKDVKDAQASDWKDFAASPNGQAQSDQMDSSDPNALPTATTDTHAESESTAKTAKSEAKAGQTVTVPNMMTQDQLNSMLGQVKQSGVVDPSESEANDLDNLLSMVPQMRQDKSPWIMGALSGIDNMFGTHYAKDAIANKQAMMGAVNNQMLPLMLRYQNELAKRKENQAKILLSGLSKEKYGQTVTTNTNTNTTGTTDTSKVTDAEKTGTGVNDPMYRLDAMRLERAKQLVMRPQVQKTLGAIHTGNLELQLASSDNGAVSKQQFDELQYVVRKLPGLMAAGNGGQTTGQERDRMTMQEMAKDLGNLKGYFTGGVNEIPANDPQLKHFRSLTKGIVASYQNMYKNYLNSIGGGIGSVIARRKDLASDWNAFVDGLAAMSDTAAAPAGPAIRKANKAATPAAKAAPGITKGGFDPDAYLKGR